MMSSPRMTALSIIAVYWLMLVLGMATCIAMRCDAPIAAIWTGTVAGTALGHGLALFNVRSWFALMTILAIAVVVGPSAPEQLSGSVLWLAFVPAACCAFWSLGDRTTLVAFWFPAVIWMLSILDHANARGVPDDTGIALLGVLAVLFLLFLRVRESRRVALWRTVVPQPTTLAQPGATTLLKERAGLSIARTGWSIVTCGLAFAATAWLAPRLWGSEQLAGTHEQAAAEHVAVGLPCCPVAEDLEVPHHRVKEYFSIGRGHAGEPASQDAHSCRRCDAEADAPGELATIDGPLVAAGGGGYGHTDAPGTAPNDDVTSYSSSYHAGRPTEYVPPTLTAPQPAPSVAAPPVENAPPPQVAPAPVPAPVVGPYEPQLAPPAVAPVQTPSIPDTGPPEVAATRTPDPVPAPAVHYAPRAASVTSDTSARPAASPIGRSALEWLAVLLGAALVMQLAAVALRPLRRFVTLRHLRRPFWQETVDQRVSNAWQLALVGLRDAGWRPDGDESPRELAERVGIAGVEQCASILERARHGIGIDAEDLTTMSTSAESAYRDARRRLGPVARAVTWLRWPLT